VYQLADTASGYLQKEQIMQPIGIDIGYGNVKFHTVGTSGSFPALVGNYQENLSIGLDRGTLENVEIGGEKFLVGESAKKHSSRIYTTRCRDWIDTIHYQALLKHALTRAGVPQQAVITTGLPVEYYRTDKERLAAIITDAAVKAGVGATVQVLPQPVGAFFSLLFNEDGSVLDPAMASMRVGILDIGYYTTDLITLDSVTVVEKQLASFENGVSTVLEAIRKDIFDTYKLQLDIHRTEEAVRRGKVQVYGTEQDIRSLTAKRLMELEAEIQAQAQVVWGNGADLDRIVLAGGGAALLAPYLKFYRHATVLRDPAAANAVGFFRNSVRKCRC